MDEELSRWGLKFDSDLVRVQGRVADRERVMFGLNQFETVGDRADWNSAFRSEILYFSFKCHLEEKDKIYVFQITKWRPPSLSITGRSSCPSEMLNRLMNSLQECSESERPFDSGWPIREKCKISASYVR